MGSISHILNAGTRLSMFALMGACIMFTPHSFFESGETGANENIDVNSGTTFNQRTLLASNNDGVDYDVYMMDGANLSQQQQQVRTYIQTNQTNKQSIKQSNKYFCP